MQFPFYFFKIIRKNNDNKKTAKGSSLDYSMRGVKPKILTDLTNFKSTVSLLKHYATEKLNLVLGPKKPNDY